MDQGATETSRSVRLLMVPFSVLAAPDGSVLAVHTGELDAADLAAMRALADELASGRLSPAEARARLNGS